MSRLNLALSASFALLGLLLVTPAPAAAAALTFTVNRIGDGADLNAGNGKCDSASASGKQCTLRAAIQEANAHGGADIIKFKITSSSKVIKPAAGLPPITDRLTINGYSQSGASVNTLAVGDNAVLKIALDGTNAGGSASGLFIQANGVVVKGLVIENFQGSGIRINASSDSVTGNFIGTAASGVTAAGNAAGVFAVDSPGTTIGGSTPAARNVISGNDGDGVVLIRSSNSSVKGDYIGTDKTGSIDLGNGGAGINILGGTGVTIGGPSSGLGNVISGNGGPGVEIQPSGVSNGSETVQGNRIGIGASGSIDLGNGSNGISIEAGDGNTIGGTGAAGNAVFFNVNGIVLSSSDNTLSGNAVENNDRVGLFIQGSSNTIGANVVLGNAVTGVLVASGTGNTITGNQIVANTGLGIDLQTGGSFGVTANDADDPDTGPNNLQNYPVLSSAVRTSNGLTTVSGTLNSLHSTTFKIEFFVAIADPSGHGEGFLFLGTTTITTNSGGDRSFAFATAQLAPGQLVTATATNTVTGDTSEFSANATVIAVP